jgi:hypothetical protein
MPSYGANEIYLLKATKFSLVSINSLMLSIIKLSYLEHLNSDLLKLRNESSRNWVS